MNEASIEIAHPVVETKPEPRSGAGQAYVLFLVCLAMFVTLGSIVQIFNLTIGLIVTEVFLILLPAIIFVKLKGLGVIRGLRINPVSIPTVILSVIVGFLGWGMAALLSQMTIPLIGESPSPDFALGSAGQLLSLLFCVAILPGVCEEALFRGVIQGVIERKGAVVAVLITGILFAALHLNPWWFVGLLYLGITFGMLTVWSGSIVPAVIAHIVNNATALIAAYLFSDNPSFVFQFQIVLAIGWLLVFPPFIWNLSKSPVQPAPLAGVSAGLPRVAAWLLGIFAAGLVLLFIAAFTLVIMFVHFKTAQYSIPGTEVTKGKQVMIAKSLMTDVPVSKDEVIAIVEDGKIEFYKVARTDDDEIWIQDGVAERMIYRDEIFGKVTPMDDLFGGGGK